MVIAGYIASLLIGVFLGLIGGGGSILTIPVLVYFFGINPIVASAYSLFIVGSTSLIGAFQKSRQQLINYRSVLYLGMPSLVAVFVVRKWVVPALPDVFFTVGDFSLTKSLFTLLLFSIIMIFAARTMLNNNREQSNETITGSTFKIIMQGTGVGFITGLVGAGGGFMIVPALILLLKMPVKTAMGSSLLIIAINSLIGFIGDVMNMTINWPLIISMSLIATAGIIIGNLLSKKVNPIFLKKGFGWFVLIVGVSILVKELFYK